MSVDIDRKVEEAFQPYQPSIDLLDRFLNEHSHMQEFALLACARLDSLANLAFSAGPIALTGSDRLLLG